MDREHVQSVERTIIVLWDILSSSALPGDRESNIEDIGRYTVQLNSGHISATHRQHYTNIQTDVFTLLTFR